MKCSIISTLNLASYSPFPTLWVLPFSTLLGSIPNGIAHMHVHQALCWLGHTAANQTHKNPHLLRVCSLRWKTQAINKICKGKNTYIWQLKVSMFLWNFLMMGKTFYIDIYPFLRLILPRSQGAGSCPNSFQSWVGAAPRGVLISWHRAGSLGQRKPSGKGM